MQRSLFFEPGLVGGVGVDFVGEGFVAVGEGVTGVAIEGAREGFGCNEGDLLLGEPLLDLGDLRIELGLIFWGHDVSVEGTDDDE